MKGRPALSVAGWRALVLDLTTRCRSICEVPWCRRLAALDPHHVLPASLGGADDADNVLMVCRTCHERFDSGFYIGRHVAEPLGGETFRVALEYRVGKHRPLLDGSMQEIVTRADWTL